MSESQPSQSLETPEQLTQRYLAAFEARDIGQCLEFFDESSVIDFQTGVYKGLKSIEGWHKDRFAANLRLERIDSLRVSGESVTVEAIVSSDRLLAWKIKSVAGRLVIKYDSVKIRHAKLTPRMNNPINSIRSGLGMDR
jgi:hypothetical protein